MAGTHDGRSEVPSEAAPRSREPATPTAPAESSVVPAPAPATGTPPHVGDAAPPAHPGRKWLLWAAVVVGLAVGGYFLIPWVKTALNTISTDDAYVNGHVTFVAPRVGGQVAKVLVDDNYRVKKGDLLVQLDQEPYQVQVALKQAAVETAQADLEAATPQGAGQVAQ